MFKPVKRNRELIKHVGALVCENCVALVHNVCKTNLAPKFSWCSRDLLININVLILNILRVRSCIESYKKH